VKNLFVSTFLVSTISFAFFNPNKYYTILVIRGVELSLGFGKDYILGYGLNLSNIFLFLNLVTFCREVIINKNFSLRIKELIVTLLAACGFFLIALGGSLNSSPFFEASFVWLIQYMQLFLVAFLLFFLYLNYKNKFELIYPVLLYTILFQSLISVLQFIRQSSLGLPVEFARIASYFAPGPEEINTLFRVNGTFLFHNQLALITLVLFVILIPKVLEQRKKVYILGIFLSLVTIVLTQSRSIWIAATSVIFFLARNYTYELKRLAKLLGFRFLIYSGVFAIVLSFIIVPRILLSFNSPFEGAGIPGRIQMISEAWEALKLSPWMGYGVGTNEYILHSQFPGGIISSFQASVHMAFLQMALEVGIPGTVFLLLPFILIARNLMSGFRTFSKKLKDFSFTYLSGVFVFVLYYLFQPHVGIVEFPYLGLILGYGLIGVYLKTKNEGN